MTAKENVLSRERGRGRADALGLAARASRPGRNRHHRGGGPYPTLAGGRRLHSGHGGMASPGRGAGLHPPPSPHARQQSRQPPADLPAIYSRKNTTDPKRAKPWMAPNGTSGMYMKEDCAVDAGHVWRSKMENNVWKPTEYPEGWEDLGPIEEVQG